jgi:hypothetical protein
MVQSVIFKKSSSLGSSANTVRRAPQAFLSFDSTLGLLKNSDRNFQFDWICVQYSVIKNQVLFDFNFLFTFSIQFLFG